MANFCIRCGSRLVPENPQCPRCGLNTAHPQGNKLVFSPPYGMPVPPAPAWAPVPPQMGAPMPPSYGAPTWPVYGAPVPLYPGPATAKERRRARRAAFDDSRLPLYGVEQWPEEGIPEGALDPKPMVPLSPPDFAGKYGV